MLILCIKIFLVSWFIVKFEPLQMFINWIWKRLPTRISGMSLIDFIYVGLSCIKCLSLWITLCITLNPFMALGLAFISSIYEKIDERL